MKQLCCAKHSAVDAKLGSVLFPEVWVTRSHGVLSMADALSRKVISECLARVVLHLSDPVVAHAFRTSIGRCPLSDLPVTESDPLVPAMERLSRSVGHVADLAKMLAEVAVDVERVTHATAADLKGANVQAGMFSVQGRELICRIAGFGARWDSKDFEPLQ